MNYKKIESSPIVGKINYILDNIAIRTIYLALIVYAMTTKEGRESKSLYIKAFYDTKYHSGLFADSIIDNPLYIPSDTEGSLNEKDAVAGRYVGFDFHRKDILGKNFNQSDSGRLSLINIDEVKGHLGDSMTPIGLLNLFNLRHVFSMETPGLEQLIADEFLRETTYEDAYRTAGVYDAFAAAMHVLDIAESAVFQVTPKGNGLVFLISDFGKPKIKEEVEKILVPQFGI